MGEVSVFGLGLMGSALARAFLGAGHQVTVWNRSAGKAEALSGLGARGAPDPRGALGASPVAVLCLDGYAAGRRVLEDAGDALAGRLVVQVSTGTPGEARALGAWVAAGGGRYLDGAILCGPNQIGTEAGEVVLAGPEAEWQAARGLLEVLGGKTRHLGAALGAASALDLAWLTMKYGQFAALAQAANLARAEALDLRELTALFPLDAAFQTYASVLREGRFGEFSASLDIWAGALARVQDAARDAGIGSEVADFIQTLFKRAQAAGMGQSNVMSIARVM